MRNLFKASVRASGGIFLLVAALSSLPAAAKPLSESQSPFRIEMKDRLAEISGELSQLKGRLGNVSKDQKNVLQEEIDKISLKITSLEGVVKNLRSKPLENEKMKVQTMVTSVERDLDRTEAVYGDKHLGLGELLGF